MTFLGHLLVLSRNELSSWKVDHSTCQMISRHQPCPSNHMIVMESKTAPSNVICSAMEVLNSQGLQHYQHFLINSKGQFQVSESFEEYTELTEMTPVDANKFFVYSRVMPNQVKVLNFSIFSKQIPKFQLCELSQPEFDGRYRELVCERTKYHEYKSYLADHNLVVSILGIHHSNSLVLRKLDSKRFFFEQAFLWKLPFF